MRKCIRSGSTCNLPGWTAYTSLSGQDGQDGQDLYYRLDNHGITIEFSPTDFTQVNFDLNPLLVDRVISLLDLSGADSVLDLFCGLGNFTLPMARYADYVTGVEGSEELVRRANRNAENNSISNVEFRVCDLSGQDAGAQVTVHGYNKVLLDPPRSGRPRDYRATGLAAGG